MKIHLDRMLFFSIVLGLAIVSTIYLIAAQKPSPGHSWNQMECTSVFCINSNTGNLGIGTASPSAKLEVLGDIKANTIKASNVGGVFIHWGSPNAPSGTTLLYSGYAFNEHYTQNGGSDAVCVKPGDDGAPGGSYYGDLLYPVGTGGYLYMPPGIREVSEIKCAVSYAPGPVFELWGSSTCPENWTAAYTGYGMGGYYTAANPSRRHCVDNVSFDSSVSNNNYGDAWYGTVMWNSQDLPSGLYTTNTYVKCAVCYKQ